MQIREQLAASVTKQVALRWPDIATKVPAITMEIPKDRSHGDYSSNVAMRLAGLLKRSPMEIAEALAKDAVKPGVATVSVAPPGFLNFTLSDAYLKRLLTTVTKAGAKFGHSTLGKNKRVHVEFISANPTGPLHMGNGRGAFIGDTLASVLSASGYRVWREYYFNDRGKQAETLAESVIRKYFIQQGIPTDYPDYCYQGEYINDLARSLKLDGVKIGDMERLRVRIQQRVIATMTRAIQKLIGQRLHIRFDRWFKESELFALKLDQRILSVLRERGLLYELEGATWMKTTQFGDDKDRVIIKSDGRTTYFFGDLAYTYEKFFRRKFDRAIILLGADHHGFVPRLQAAAAALGQPGALGVLIYQLVRLIKGGQEVRMSKRAGNFVTLDELIDWVGPDVARFFFLMHGADTHMDFDLDLAKERSEKNPVFYVQYAHARIASLIRKVDALMKPKRVKKGKKQELGVKLVKGEFGDAERKLLRLLVTYPDVVEDVARSYAVQQLPFYAMKLAQGFHEYYDSARIIDNDTVNLCRLFVVKATQQVLQNCLKLMGVSAPEKM